jgi:peptide/nickel transport system ATP-binding protein
VLIADEPTTALDVTTQAQILRLIRDLQKRKGTSVLFITHDFGVVAEIADRVAVMQQGRLVEQGPAAKVLNAPEHPYTRQLIAAVPPLAPPKPTRVSATPALVVADVSKTYSTGGFLGRGRASPRRWTRSRSSCPRARPWAWSASRAPASRRWRAASCG